MIEFFREAIPVFGIVAGIAAGIVIWRELRRVYRIRAQLAQIRDSEPVRYVKFKISRLP